MADRYIISLMATFRIKHLLWPRLNSRFVQKMLLKQRSAIHAPPKSMLRGVTASIRCIDGYDCITITPKKYTTDKKILYLHGGAFILPITRLHWRAIIHMARIAKTTVVVPMCPQLPEYSYKDIHRHIKEVYKCILKETSPSNIVVMGDSAGGNLALVLPLLVTPARQPSRVITFSPLVDVGLGGPGLDTLENQDPLLPLRVLRHVLPRYYGDERYDNPLVSPLYADYRHVKSKICIFNGGKDLLSPDITRFHESLVKRGIDHEYHFEKYLLHAWVIFPLRSSHRTRLQIAKTLKT